MQILVTQIVRKLTVLLDVKYIYKSGVTFKNCNTSLFILILEGNCSSLTRELSSMVAKIFQEETNFLYRIFSFEYAARQLKEENLFFVHGCSWEKQIFRNPNAEPDIFHRYQIVEKVLVNIQSGFEKECKKITSFLEGAHFFIEKDNLPQAAFMFHQYIELWFRYAALFTMGKERKSHGIKELQTYVKAFVPELGNLFDTGAEKEQSLLKLLDEAYITTRYQNNYHINKAQILSIQEKAMKTYTLVSKLFNDKMEACRKEFIETKKNDNNTSGEAMTDSQKTKCKLQELINRKLCGLNPDADKLYYKANFRVNGIADILYDIAGIMKVCIIAVEYANGSQGRLIPQPHINIQTALEHILQLLPFEEVECLEEIIEKYILPYENEEKETIENPARP